LALCAVGVGPKGIQPTNVACLKRAWDCVKAMMPQPVGHVTKQFVLSLAEDRVIEIVNVEQIDVAWLPEPSLDEIPRSSLRNDKSL
jgi:ABC-type phosphate/phosphonate transport system substrate-binding protein